MRKIGMLVLILLMATSMLCGCAAAPETPLPTAPEQTQAADTSAVSESGVAVGQAIDAQSLDELRAQNKQLVVYFQGKKISETEEILQKKLALVKDDYAELLRCDYYTIPLSDYKPAGDILGGNLFGLVLFQNGEAIVLSGDSRNNVDSAFNRFFEYDLIAPDDHGLTIVTYDEVMKKIQGGESFILYVGRDTCPQCRLFAPNLEEGIVNRGLSTPVYYFNVQSYNTAQQRGEANADEAWNDVTNSIGFMGTPSLLYFKDSVSTSFDLFNSLFPEDAKSQEEFDESNRLCLTALEGWLNENGIK